MLDATRSPDPALETLLDGWRSRGRDLVAQHWSEFEALLSPVEAAIDRGRYAEAAAAAQIAAAFAVFWHGGVFVSHRLERALIRIGEAALPTPGHDRMTGDAEGPRRILHVATQVAGIGGHSRNIWRWIASDAGAMHSVALTRQTGAAPSAMRRAVKASGGEIFFANTAIGGPLAWSAALQRRLATADLVVLHVHNQDVIPFLALAGMKRRPKVVLLNHADHVFWLGTDFADAVISTRLSGRRLCAGRRAIPDERNLTMPLCLERVKRPLDRRAAKAALGLEPDSILLLTVARSVKFRPIGGLSFADALLPLLLAEPRARLIAVGPGGVVDWSKAQSQAPGRIVVLPETPDTGVFFQAADIYIDSFPFPSNTSLFEAGLHELPLVSRQPFGPGCEIMGADSIGLDEHLQTAQSLGAFRDLVGGLIADADRRRTLGRATRAAIEATNVGAGFSSAFATLCAQIDGLPPRDTRPAVGDAPRFDTIDLYSHFVFGAPDKPGSRRTATQRRDMAVEISLKTMSPAARLRAWLRLAFTDAFAFRSRRDSWRYLIPEWLTARLRQDAEGSAR
jgi:hypothetical protein